MIGKFAYHTQQYYAFEKHYYELVNFETPLHFLENHLLQTMENIGKPMFKVPKTYSKTGKDLIFIFEIQQIGKTILYFYKCVITDKTVIKKYEKNKNYNDWMD